MSSKHKELFINYSASNAIVNLFGSLDFLKNIASQVAFPVRLKLTSATSNISRGVGIQIGTGCENLRIRI